MAKREEETKTEEETKAPEQTRQISGLWVAVFLFVPVVGCLIWGLVTR